MAFIAFIAGAFIAFIAATGDEGHFMAFGMVKDGKTKHLEMFDLTKKVYGACATIRFDNHKDQIKPWVSSWVQFVGGTRRAQLVILENAQPVCMRRNVTRR